MKSISPRFNLGNSVVTDILGQEPQKGKVVRVIGNETPGIFTYEVKIEGQKETRFIGSGFLKEDN